MKGIKWRRPVWLIKLFHWEYWPMDLICAPVGIYWVWLGIKARSFYFLNAANPGIHTGGFVMESKNDVYGLLPEGLYPRTVPVGKKIRFEELLEQMLSKNIGFPCIAKPDIGMQGLGVKKIVSEEQLRSYHERMPLAWLVQAYVDYPNEAGIFYHRMPHEQKGRITGIVLKEFARITGNGIDTVETLVKENERYALYWDSIAHELGPGVSRVPADGEDMQVLDYGNHARGSKFLDGTHLVDPSLENFIDGICSRIPGFYFGRLDIKYRSWEGLSKGDHFSIIELNGSGSSPTHMFDPKHSIVFAWKEIIRHWRLTYEIARYNHIHCRVPYLSFAKGIREVRASARVKRILSSKNW